MLARTPKSPQGHDGDRPQHTGHATLARTSASGAERERHDAILDALTQRHYQRCLQIGCASGWLTEQLAWRCSRVDVAAGHASAQARARLTRPGGNIHFFPSGLADGEWGSNYDLIVLSDVLHHFTIPALVRLAARVAEVVKPRAEFVVAHGSEGQGQPLSCDRATELFQLLVRAERKTRLLHAAYRLETWLAPDVEVDMASAP
ncbi:MAG TPA: class I SAM-dependent methyltransferase [Dyella sp.]|uniref:class I SAM-dependent methyltransferase n=1 Tax=Dyella sp. TaxID=1869338 RepID=UPI002D79670B|nr:class I SAM-dependent methyltransferase [Dyella sp.]HET6553419.1 class I SAM-dependent methyltransferase [Dyella sp.]